MEQKTFCNIQRNFESSNKLKKIHIIKRNLLYLTNIPKELNLPLLVSNQFLGQYGLIKKSCIKKNNSKNAIQNSFTVLITFEKEIDAAMAILALNRFKINKNVLYASFGLTRFCSAFLQNKNCKSKKCYFLHFQPNEEDIISGKENLIRDQNLNEENVFKFLLKSKFQSYLSDSFKKKSNLELNNFFPSKVTSLEKLKKFLKKNKQIISKKNQNNFLYQSNISLCENEKNFCLEKNNIRKSQRTILNINKNKNKQIKTSIDLLKKNQNELISHNKNIFFSSESEKEFFYQNNKNKSESLKEDFFSLKKNQKISCISIEDQNNKIIKNKYILNGRHLTKKNDDNNSLLSEGKNVKKQTRLRKNQFFSYQKDQSHNTYSDLKNNNSFQSEKIRCIEDEDLIESNVYSVKKNDSNLKKKIFTDKSLFFSSKNKEDLSSKKKNQFLLSEKIDNKSGTINICKNEKMNFQSEESSFITIDSEKEISLMEKFFSKNLKRRILGIQKKFKYTFVLVKEKDSHQVFWKNINNIFNSENPWQSKNSLFLE